MTTDERVKELEAVVVELCDIMRSGSTCPRCKAAHLAWGHHGDNVHTRAFDVLARAETLAEVPREQRRTPVTTGRKFR